MKALESILREHAGRYPEMRPADAVKLIYQNEFGGGHLIRDEQACLNYLRREYEATEKDPAMPLYSDIGNGIIRVNLAATSESDLERLGQAFLCSARAHKGDLNSFKAKLAVLVQLTGEGVFRFTPDELQTYLTGYEEAGFPMVSHSPEYRAAYRPAYRIVLRSKYL